jgi:hypothetical protein
VEANGHYTGEAIFTRLKTALDVSIRRFPRSLYTYRKLFWPALVPDDASLRIDMCGRFGSLDRDANFTRMKAALDLSIWRFQRSFYTYRRPFWKTPVLRRCISENRRVGGLLMRIGDANVTQLNTPLNLSIWRFQRSFYTYRKLFWQAPVAR